MRVPNFVVTAAVTKPTRKLEGFPSNAASSQMWTSFPSISNGTAVASTSPPLSSDRRPNHDDEKPLASHTTAAKPSAGGDCSDRGSPGAAGQPVGNVVGSRS